MICLEVAAGLGDKRRIGGHAVEQAGGRQLLDLGDVGRIDEKFHGYILPGRLRLHLATALVDVPELLASQDGQTRWFR